MNKLDAQRQKEIQQAEELLFAGPQALGFAKGLFQGHFVADWVMPYPRIPAAQQTELDETLAELRKFLDEHLDAAEIDRQADIPRSVIDGLGRVGVLGMTAPKEYGGRGFSQMANCKVLEEIGRRCASTSVFVNAHHSIGIRALLLFGTHEQKQKWLPKLVTGEQLGAFALTPAGNQGLNIALGGVLLILAVLGFLGYWNLLSIPAGINGDNLLHLVVALATLIVGGGLLSRR